MIDRLMMKPDSNIWRVINNSKDVISMMINANHDRTMRSPDMMFPLFHEIRVLN